jgi:hypothetical protein
VRATPILFATLLLAACGPRDRDVRIARARAETKMLSQSLERIEDRLIANQARVHLWQELKLRHESVTAIACVSQEEHAAEMAMHALPPSRSATRVAAQASRASSRVAAAVSGAEKPLIRTGQK